MAAPQFKYTSQLRTTWENASRHLIADLQQFNAAFTTYQGSLSSNSVTFANTAAFANTASFANSASFANTALSANNTAHFNGQLPAFYTNASNITTGSLAKAQQHAQTAYLDVNNVFTKFQDINPSAISESFHRYRLSGTTYAIIGAAGAIKGTSSTDLGIITETGRAIRFMTNGSPTDKAILTTDGRFQVPEGFHSYEGAATVAAGVFDGVLALPSTSGAYLIFYYVQGTADPTNYSGMLLAFIDAGVVRSINVATAGNMNYAWVGTVFRLQQLSGVTLIVRAKALKIY